VLKQHLPPTPHTQTQDTFWNASRSNALHQDVPASSTIPAQTHVGKVASSLHINADISSKEQENFQYKKKTDINCISASYALIDIVIFVVAVLFTRHYV
jgi:hypothetical protein